VLRLGISETGAVPWLRHSRTPRLRGSRSAPGFFTGQTLTIRDRLRGRGNAVLDCREEALLPLAEAH
jgi:hypothetical protein